jgi:predicted PurR-regulated permease PerM
MFFGSKGHAEPRAPQGLARSSMGDLGDFAARVVIVALVVASALIVWKLSGVLLSVFASILLAVAWRGTAHPLQTRFGLSAPLAMTTAALAFVALVGLSGAAFGGRLLDQYDVVAADLPKSFQSIEDFAETHPLGRYVQEFLANGGIGRATAPIASTLAAFVGSLSGVLSSMLIILLGGIYFALDPDRYLSGALALAPAGKRAALAQFMDKSGLRMRQWLLVQLFVVVVNTTLAGLGLWLFGVAAPLALATLAGALAFVPFVGSIVAIAVGALAALPQGPEHAGYAATAIAAASFVEGYVFTPYVQSRTLSLAPAVLIFSMSAFGLLFGVAGVILAAPATIILAVALESLRGPVAPPA